MKRRINPLIPHREMGRAVKGNPMDGSQLGERR